MISALLRPKRILEIGTFTGYSAICLARGLAEGGELHTIEANGELEHIIRKYVAESNMSDRIVLHLGDALAIIPTLDETFDLVFIDAGKVDYSMYYDLVFKKMRIGGLMLADNVLWSGKVLDGDSQDADTQSLQAFNQKVLQDVRVEKVMLPLRDGLLLIRKIKE